MEEKPIPRKRNAILAFTLLVFVSGAFFCVSHPVIAQADQAYTKIQAATDSLNQAFIALSDAEKAGANITSLLNLWNGAAGRLSQAENAYRAGDMNAAGENADAVLPIALLITEAAQNAQENALASSQTVFWSTLVLTVVGASVLVVALFVVWRLIKRSYINRLSDAKPEVVSDEA